MTAWACPTGCGRTRKSGQLMCPPCWGRVPSMLKRDVLRTWNRRLREPLSTDARAKHTEASEVAIASIA